MAFDNTAGKFASGVVALIDQGITTDVVDGAQIRALSQIAATGSDLVRTYSEYISNPYYAVLQIAQSQIDPFNRIQPITRTFQVENCIVTKEPTSVFDNSSSLVLGAIPDTQTIIPSGYSISIPVFVPGPLPLKLTVEHESASPPILEENYSWLDTTVDLQSLEVTSFMSALTSSTFVKFGTTRIRQNSNPLHSGGWELL